MQTTVYMMVSLTHVKTDAEKDEIRELIRWLEDDADVALLRWAFDTETWTPKPVDNIFVYDNTRVMSADLGIALYLSNDGSDGRGGEVIDRIKSGKPFRLFAREGVNVSRYPADCLTHHGGSIDRFTSLKDLKTQIHAALKSIEASNDQLALFEQVAVA